MRATSVDAVQMGIRPIIAREAVGEEPETVARGSTPAGAVRLRVQNLSVQAGEEGAGAPLRAISFEVAVGEIVGGLERAPFNRQVEKFVGLLEL